MRIYEKALLNINNKVISCFTFFFFFKVALQVKNTSQNSSTDEWRNKMNTHKMEYYLAVKNELHSAT